MAIESESGTLGALAADVTLLTREFNTVGAEVTVPSAFTGTITFEVRYGSEWQTATCLTPARGTATSTLTAAGTRIINTAGANAVRGRVSAFTSGSATLVLSASPGGDGPAAGGGGGGGDASEATLATRLSESDFDTKIGSLTESAPATDTDSSGLNGRLQRIAQRLTTIISGLIVVGNVAHDDADSGAPVKIGFKAVAHGTSPSAVTAGDRVDSIASRQGLPYHIGGHPNTLTVGAKYTSAQTNTAIVTVSAGTKIVVTGVSVTCNNANTVNVGAVVGLATATTPTTTGVILAHGGIAPGSGHARGHGAAILAVGADDEDVRITSDVPTGGDIWVVVTYYTVAS